MFRLETCALLHPGSQPPCRTALSRRTYSPGCRFRLSVQALSGVSTRNLRGPAAHSQADPLPCQTPPGAATAARAAATPRPPPLRSFAYLRLRHPVHSPPLRTRSKHVHVCSHAVSRGVTVLAGASGPGGCRPNPRSRCIRLAAAPACEGLETFAGDRLEARGRERASMDGSTACPRKRAAAPAGPPVRGLAPK